MLCDSFESYREAPNPLVEGEKYQYASVSNIYVGTWRSFLRRKKGDSTGAESTSQFFPPRIILCSLASLRKEVDALTGEKDDPQYAIDENLPAQQAGYAKLARHYRELVRKELRGMEPESFTFLTIFSELYVDLMHLRNDSILPEQYRAVGWQAKPLELYSLERLRAPIVGILSDNPRIRLLAL